MSEYGYTKPVNYPVSMTSAEHAHRLDMTARALHVPFGDAADLYCWLTDDDAHAPEFITTRLKVIEQARQALITQADARKALADVRANERGSAPVKHILYWCWCLVLAILTFTVASWAFMAAGAFSTTGVLTPKAACDSFSLIVALPSDSAYGATVEEVWGDVHSGGKGQAIGHLIPGSSLEYKFNHLSPGTYAATVNLVFDNGRTSTPEKVAAVVGGGCEATTTTAATAPDTTMVVEPSVPIVPPPTTLNIDLPPTFITNTTTAAIPPATITGTLERGEPGFGDHYAPDRGVEGSGESVELPKTGAGVYWFVMVGCILLILGFVGWAVGLPSARARQLRKEMARDRERSMAKHPSNPNREP